MEEKERIEEPKGNYGRSTVLDKLNGELPNCCVQNYLVYLPVCLAKRLTDDWDWGKQSRR